MHALMDRIGYRFKDAALLEAARTHPSYGSDHNVPHYQRLEFLGDAVLQLAVTQTLFDRYPGIDEGRLTRARASIVCEESLCESARRLELGRWVRLSVGEEKSGGRDKPSILADVMEAVFAAVYLDGGIDAAFLVIRSAILDDLGEDIMRERPDYKSQLQIRLQKSRGADPTYELILASGEAHKPTFLMQVMLGDEVLGRGEGLSKQAAQQAAARDALERGDR